MIQSLFQIVSNECIARNTYKMVLSGDVSSINRPGQFVNIKLKGFFLRRPISVCDIDRSENTLTIVYKVVGKGTEFMSRLPMNEQLDVLSGLGNGYDTSLCGEYPLLIGGGAGVPPMFLLAKQLISEGKIPMVIAGFNTFDECFFEDEFKKIGARIIIATADGSCGVKGFVTDAMRCFNAESNDGITAYTDYCVCGPEPMLKAVFDIAETSGQLSFEERMAAASAHVWVAAAKQNTVRRESAKTAPFWSPRR